MSNINQPMKKNLNILFIEDSDDDAMLIERELTRGGYQIFSMRIDNEAALLQTINLHAWDLVLADYVLPQFSGINAIRLIRTINADVPCIMISGKAGEETAVEAMKAGAADFLLKNRLSRLLPVVEREINEAEVRKEKKIIESQLSEKEEQYLKLFESASDAIIIIDNYKFVDSNHQMYHLLGYEKADIIGKCPWELSPTYQENGLSSFESAKKILNEGTQGINQQFEWQFLCKDQTLLLTEITLSSFLVREKTMLMAVIRNITERKTAERNQKLAADILEALNHPDDQIKLIEKILQLIKDSTHAETVGIRLKDENDYPFYVSSGFPKNFSELHTNLYRTDSLGKIIKDSKGNISYSCLCGSVISGESNFNPALFTKGGSFVMGSQLQFYEGSHISEHSDLRGQCLKVGYESIALIPLKSGDEVIGILQLSDHRKNLFPPSMVQYFEGIGSSIGIAIKRINDDEKIRLNEEKMRGIIENSADAIVLADEQGRIIEWNQAAEYLMGFSRAEAIGKNLWDIQYLTSIDENKTEQKLFELQKFIQGFLKNGTQNIPDLFATQLQKPNGEISHIQTRLFSVKTIHGNKLGSISRDITELKKAREVELRNMEILETLSRTAMDFVGLTVDKDIYGYIANKLGSLAPGAMIFTGPFDNFTGLLKLERVAGIPDDTLMELNTLAGGDYRRIQFPIEPSHIEKLSKGTIECLPDFWRQKYESIVESEGNPLPRAIKATHAFSIGLSDQNHFYGLVLFLVPLDQELNKALIETFISQASVALTKLNILSELQKSQQRFNSLFEQNNDILFTIDSSENITSINPIGEQLITGKFSEGIHLKNLLSTTAYNRLRKIFYETAKRNLQFCSAEIDLTARNGSLLTFQMNFSITYQNRRIYEIFGIARNITTNKMLQNQILSKIIETEEREKKSFAEELHDGLGSLLSTINIYVGLLQKKEKSEEDRAKYLKELNKLVREAVNNVRLFANSLTPNVLNDFGILTALRLFGEKINVTRPGLIKFNLPDKLPKTDKIVEINLYRILMELINNSMKYSSAQNIGIMMKSEEKNLILSFTDDGKGFDVDQILNSEASGMGVKNILARVKTINGSCDFESMPGEGVNVHIMVPRSLKPYSK